MNQIIGLPGTFGFGGAGEVAFDPLTLFTGGAIGDFGQADKLVYTDAAGTTPAVVGDAVARHDGARGVLSWRQTTLAKRPLLGVESGKSYLTFDGARAMVTSAAFNMTGVDAFTLVMALRKLSDVTDAFVIEASASSGSTSGNFYLLAPRTAGANNYSARSRGTASSESIAPSSYASPHSAVLSVQGDISADTNILRLNGDQVGTSASDQGTGNLGNHSLYLGARNQSSSYFTGRIHRWFLIGKLLTAAELLKVEKWAAKGNGVTI